MSTRLTTQTLFSNNSLYMPISFMIALILGIVYSLMPFKYFIVLLLSLAFMIFTYLKLEIVIAILIASMLFQKSILPVEISLTRLVSIPVFLVCFYKLIKREKRIKIDKNLDIAIILLYLWMLVSVIYARNLSYVIENLATFFQLIITYFLLKTFIEDSKTLHRIILIIVIFGFIQSLGSILSIMNDPGQLIESATYRDSERIEGTTTNPNMFARGLVFMLTLAIYSFVSQSNLIVIPILIFSFLIFCTFSRAGIVGMFIVYAVSMYFMIKQNKKWILYSFILIIALISTFFALNRGNQLLKRIETIQSMEGNSINIRLDMIKTAIDMGAKNPIFGVGLNNFINNSHLYGNKCHFRRAAHNGYLDVFATLGFPGIILLIIILYFSMNNILDYRNHLKEQNIDTTDYRFSLANFLLIAFVSYLIMAFFGGLIANKLFWVLLSFTSILNTESTNLNVQMT